MKIIQMMKQLNNTELGKGGTHDTYVLVPNELNISQIFDQPDHNYEFIDISSGDRIRARNTIGREKRIVGLGQYYRNQNLSAGDSIVFEKRIDGTNIRYRIWTIKLQKAIVFQKMKNGFEILTPDRLNAAQKWGELLTEQLNISFLEAIKKRNDSPDTTDIYKITIAGKSIGDSFSAKENGIIEMSGEKVVVRRFYGWKTITVEEDE